MDSVNDKMSENICKFCLKFNISGCFESVTKYTADILEILKIKVNFNENVHPLICSSCLMIINQFFDFKCTCLYTEDLITPYLESKGAPISLWDVYVEEKDIKISSHDSQQKICRLCMECISDDGFALSGLESDASLIKQFIQFHVTEMDLTATNDPHICKTCHSSIKTYSEFMITYMSVEDSIENYLTENGKLIMKPLALESSDPPTNCDRSENEENVPEQTRNVPSPDDPLDLSKDLVTDEEDEFKLSKNDASIDDSLDMSADLVIDEADKDSFSDNGMELMDSSVPWEDCTLSCSSTNQASLKRTTSTGQQTRVASSSLLKPKPLCQNCRTLSDKDDGKLIYKTMYFDQDVTVTVEGCRKCIKLIDDQEDLKQWIFKYNALGGGKARYVCTLCRFTTKTRFIFKRHILNHKYPFTRKVFECKICSHKGCLTIPSFRKHMMKHSKNVTCEICGYVANSDYFMWQHTLKNHVRGVNVP